MILTPNKVEEYTQKPGIDGLYESIRDAAAVCYQTDVEKMKLEPKEFVEQVLLKNGHTRPLEFGTVYLTVPFMDITTLNHYRDNPWSKMAYSDGVVFITTNIRVVMQGGYKTDIEAFNNNYDLNFLADLRYLAEIPVPERHQLRRTFAIIASRGATDDMRTHIALSSICESTRFCNYSKDKFGNELTFIDPVWWKNDEGVYNTLVEDFQIDETKYISASTYCKEAQQLKRILPLGIKAELRLCGFNDAWENFLWRRCDSHADPECQLVGEEIKRLFTTNPSQTTSVEV